MFDDARVRSVIERADLVGHRILDCYFFGCRFQGGVPGGASEGASTAGAGSSAAGGGSALGGAARHPALEVAAEKVAVQDPMAYQISSFDHTADTGIIVHADSLPELIW